MKILEEQGNAHHSQANERTDPTELTTDLQQNIQIFRDLFDRNGTLRVREFQSQCFPQIKCGAIFFDGMSKSDSIDFHIVKPVLNIQCINENLSLFEFLKTSVITIGELSEKTNVFDLAQDLLYGDTIFLVDGFAKALILNTKGFEKRGVDEPESERVTTGPREGFNESLMGNLALLRRKILNHDLKYEMRTFGNVTQTRACICYIDSIADEAILKEFEKRLDGFDFDSALDVNYIKEGIKDHPFSPFQTAGTTERPDIVAAKLLEGRIALFLDGTPVVLTIPHLMVELIQSNEDYYTNFYFSSLNRIIRILSMIIAITLPAVFLALTTFNQELIPSPLLYSISGARQNVPFPTIVEIIALLLVFDILREGGSRMSTNAGQAFGIVGALVLGQAAVDAKIVAGHVVVVVALVGIASLMLPKMSSAIIICRIFLLACTLVLGFYGLAFGMLAILVHLYSMRSFGVPFMSSIVTFEGQEMKDTAIRAPMWLMNLRPRFLTKNRLRNAKKDRIK